MSLSSSLKKKSNKVNDVNPEWRHFLKDFRNSLISSSKTIEINLYHARIFRFRLRDLLNENNLPYDCLWIIIWLNNLETELNFKDVTRLLIPDYNEIVRIRNLFDGSRRAA